MDNLEEKMKGTAVEGTVGKLFTQDQLHDQLSQTDVPPPSIDLIYWLGEHG